jgi:signal transduction histidine kinase
MARSARVDCQPREGDVTQTSEPDLRLSRQVYRLRILGLALGAVAVATVLDDNHAPPAAWAILAFHVFVWPHLAYFAARRSGDPHKIERASLTIDSAFGGFWIALMHFNLLPSVLIATMMSMDKIGWGPAFLARTLAAMAAGCAFGAILTHGAVAPDTTMRIIVASLPLMTAYPLAVAFTSYKSGKLTRERKKAIEQSVALREQLAHIARVGTLGEMAAGLAHELNQPLTAMHFEAVAAMELPPDEALAGMREALATIADQSLRAGEIVKRMRTFARRGDRSRQVTDLRPLIQEVLALVAHDLRLNGIVTNERLDQVPPVLVDPIEVQQVLVNLIRNAIEAMAPTAAGERRLTIEMRREDRYVRVSVADTGSGVDPAVAPRLFHPFHSTKPTGLGLGLSISQSLIEAHGGRMGVLDTAGPGAVFFFDLPPAAR